jgi:hypothetical protein
MIQQATEKAIRGLLQQTVDAVTKSKNAIPVLISDVDEVKNEMPYIVIQCTDSEEIISPGCGIFKVNGVLVFKSHTRVITPKRRQDVLDAINNFAYDSTALKLSLTDNFHCHGWHPTTGEMTTDDATKATIYTMRYWVYCMAMNNT